MSELFFNLAILFTIIGIFGSMAVASYRSAPWVPSRRKDLERIIALSGIKKGQIVFELGAGDGRVIIELAKRFDAQFVGYEISIIPYLICQFRILLMNNIFVHRLKGSAKILYKDFFSADFSKADLIFFFLTPYGIKKLEKKFKTEMKKGSRIISYAFPLKYFSSHCISKPKERSVSIYCYHF